MPRVNDLLSSNINRAIQNQITWSIFYNVKEEGAIGNGAIDDYPAINNLINNKIQGNALVIFPKGEYLIRSNMTVPPNVFLYFVGEGLLKPDAGVTITINGGIIADAFPIFVGEGNADGSKPICDKIYPQWWGAKGDGTSDDTQSIIKTRGMAGEGSTIFFLSGSYKVTEEDVLSSPAGSRYLAEGYDSTFLFNDQVIAIPTFTTIASLGPDKVVGTDQSGNLQTYDVSAEQLVNMNADVANMNGRIDNIVAQSGDDNTEIVDARQPETGSAYPVLGARLNAVDAQLADIAINVKKFGAKGDGETDDTVAIQKALDDCKTVFIPDGEFIVNADMYIRIPSNRKLILSKFAVLKAKPSANSDYRIINIQDVENVEIIGGTIQGERYEHTGTTGEQGHGVVIRGSANVVVRDTLIKDCWGDGIYIGSGNTFYSENITIDNVMCDNNRRQGISVVSVKNLLVLNSKLINTNGTAPESGIDIEPNNVNGEIKGVKIINLYTENNAMQGIIVALHNFANSNKTIDITIENHTDIGSVNGFALGKCSGGFYGKINLINSYYENCKQQGIQVRDYDISAPTLQITKPTIINTNTSNNTNDKYTSGIVVFKETTDTSSTSIGNVVIEEPTIKDTRVVKTMGYAIYIRDLTFANVKSVKIVNPLELSANTPVGFYGEGVLIDDFKVTMYDPTSGFTFSMANYHRYVTNKNFPSQKTVTLNSSISPNNPEVTFIMENDFQIIVDPGSSTKIAPLAATGQAIRGTGIGSRITIKKLDGTTWIVTEMIGTWAVV